MSRIVELVLGVKEVQMDGYRYVVVCNKEHRAVLKALDIPLASEILDVSVPSAL